MSALLKLLRFFAGLSTMSTVLFVLQNKKELQSMQKCGSIIEKIGLTQISDETAKCLLDAFYKVEKEQGYLNESVTTIISYLHMREEEAKKPIVRFQSRGESGNIYYLMKLVADALDDNEATQSLWKRVKQGNYDEALVKIREQVRLIDLDGVY